MTFWRSARLSGVHPDILVFKPVFWRSDRLSGVRLDFLAFRPVFWCSTIIWRGLQLIWRPQLLFGATNG
ncbi:hypothetical protein [Sporosarcina cyprini]|uniref:hypothetical protein n=1 Tax=Sporosarcina cyprini TaxID=2910523 RepID=UPI001EE02AB0|nr:hypothetical protein [Sporosarcina cyprini]MCG3087233.1 hypothetical protein [Sporosarcina cyprini]